MSAKITIRFIVPAGYCDTDYAQLHGNGGSGEIDWETPVDNRDYGLFPNGAGIYGWGGAPWGHFRWGRGHAMQTAGFGFLPWGRFPWGHGAGRIEAAVTVHYCGDYKFALACYSGAGNIHEGTPEELEVTIHIAPPTPTGLTKTSYDKDTDVLVLAAA